ncbi:hypothetical protein SAMN04488057_101302 [Cyclobacterium lianum]|uniref:Uncharacterized protein n=1 Tax=Cyclobacterium lianum TaxID=388280 RepID=A0A1M7IEX8_9BACT|nr:hypothetical protein SAMN04488057_101302 [Cyclobacterium lianum]
MVHNFFIYSKYKIIYSNILKHLFLMIEPFFLQFNPDEIKCIGVGNHNWGRRLGGRG